MTTEFVVRFDDDTPDSAIASWMSAQLLHAGRLELGLTLAHTCVQAARAERAATPTRPPTDLSAVLSRTTTQKPGIPGDGPTSNGDADLEAAASAPPPQPDPPATSRCMSTRMVDGVSVECAAGIYLAERPAFSLHDGGLASAPQWLHIDPELDAHYAIGPVLS